MPIIDDTSKALAAEDQPKFFDTNWAGNITFTRSSVKHPTSVDEVCALVRSAERVKVVGTRHSFNAAADTTGTQLSLLAISRIVDIDPVASTVTIQGGLTYAQLTPVLRA